jgi:hypothetical protein
MAMVRHGKPAETRRTIVLVRPFSSGVVMAAIVGMRRKRVFARAGGISFLRIPAPAASPDPSPATPNPRRESPRLGISTTPC